MNKKPIDTINRILGLNLRVTQFGEIRGARAGIKYENLVLTRDASIELAAAFALLFDVDPD
jgi:hypothetical protein